MTTDRLGISGSYVRRCDSDATEDALANSETSAASGFDSVMPLIGVGGKERGVCGNRDCGAVTSVLPWAVRIRFGLYTACGGVIYMQRSYGNLASRLAINLRLHTIHFNLGYITFLTIGGLLWIAN